jgi:hypothetical protein
MDRTRHRPIWTATWQRLLDTAPVLFARGG